MLEENQQISINCKHNKIKEYYLNKGYKIDKIIYVNVEDLMPGSSKKVNVICDYCGKKYSMVYSHYYKNVLNGIVHKCACSDCDYLKQQETMIFKYGVDNPRKIESVNEKVKQTCLQKYGVDNPMKIEEISKKQQDSYYINHGYCTPFQNKSVQEKAIATRKNKYGVDYIMQSKHFQEKTQNKIRQKYGVSFPFQSEVIRNKIEGIFYDKYGGKTPLINDDVLSKSSITRFLNNTCLKSKTQEVLINLFNGIGNFPIGRYNVDILLDDNIVLEYDGGGHNLGIKLSNLSENDFIKHEEERNRYIIGRGYRIIKFKNNNDNKYSNIEYIDALNLCLQKYIKKYNYVEYDFSNKNITSSNLL